MFSLKNPENDESVRIIKKRELAIIELIKTYKWSIPTTLIDEFNITWTAVLYLRGSLLTPRNYDGNNYE